jgi:hypothetical protein
MAIKLKTKSKAKLATGKKTAVTSSTGIEVATKLLPEAFKLKKEISLLAAKTKNLTDKLNPIETEIRGLVDPELDGTASVNLINGDLVMGVSARVQSRTIKDTDDVVIALEEFEEGLALKLAKFALGDLDKYFSPAEMEVLTEIKEGNRRLKYG